MKEWIEQKIKEIYYAGVDDVNISESEYFEIIRRTLIETRDKALDEAIEIVHSNDPYSTDSEKIIEKLSQLKDKA